MRLHILSDLHLETLPFRALHTDADVVILAGDIGVKWSGIEWAKCRAFRDKVVLYVPGNHEFYGAHMSRVAVELRARAAETPNIQLLDNDEVLVGGVRFLGATLWTDFELYGTNRCVTAMKDAAASIYDFRSIRYGSTGYLTPPQTVTLHRQSRAWLEKRLAEPFTGKTVVITHHAPHPNSVHARFRGIPLNPAFVSDLTALMGKCTLWVHGHTHNRFDYVVNGTRVICNARGYCRLTRTPDGSRVEDKEHDDFSPDLVVELI